MKRLKFGLILIIICVAVVLTAILIPKIIPIKQSIVNLSAITPLVENGSIILSLDCNDSSQDCTTLKNVQTCLKAVNPINENYSQLNYDQCLQAQTNYEYFYNEANVCLSIINQKIIKEKIECNKKPDLILKSSCENIQTDIYPFNQYYENLPIIRCTVNSSEDTYAILSLNGDDKIVKINEPLKQGINSFELQFPLGNDQNTEIKKHVQISINNNEITTLEFTVKESNIIKWFDNKDEKRLVVGFSNPDDPVVQALTAQAKEFMPTRTLDGYLSGNINSIKLQAKALFNAIKLTQISYVNDAIRFGNADDSQKINTPSQSLLKKSANCIDGTLLLSAMAESIGLEPVIVFMPGHALVGIKLFPNASLNFNETYYLETTVVSKDTPTDANKIAQQNILGNVNNTSIVDVKTTRNTVKPFPFKEQTLVTIPTPDQATLDQIKGKNLDEEFYLGPKKGIYYCFQTQTNDRVLNTIDFTATTPITFLYITKQGINTFETQGTFDYSQIEQSQGCLRNDALTHYSGICQTTSNYCLFFYSPGEDTAKVNVKHYTTFLD
ncbi:Uncharacterised protein [uncultured archaeon]|nr:Uncharacterised protein [uncultured archaeon]